MAYSPSEQLNIIEQAIIKGEFYTGTFKGLTVAYVLDRIYLDNTTYVPRDTDVNSEIIWQHTIQCPATYLACSNGYTPQEW